METPEPHDAEALAEEAEAEAAAAEAAAAAALARARALKMRRRAEAAAAVAPSSTTDPAASETADAVTDDDVTVDDETADAVTDDAARDGSDEPVESDTQHTPPRRRLRSPRVRLSWIAAALAVVCTAGFLGASGYMMVHHRHVVAEQQRKAELAAAARQAVVTLMSLDYNDAQNVVKRILDNTTGDFRNDFQSQADEFARVAQSSRVVTEATVDATAVQSTSGDNGTVLVAVTTQVANAASKQQQPRTWRLRVDMARDGEQLKLAKVEFVP